MEDLVFCSSQPEATVLPCFKQTWMRRCISGVAEITVCVHHPDSPDLKFDFLAIQLYRPDFKVDS